MKDIISRLDDRKRMRIGEILRFGIVGVIAVLIQYGIYGLLIHVLDYNISMTIAYLISFAFNFYASTKYTFRVSRDARRGAGFALSHAINYLLQIATLNAFIMGGVSKALAPIPMFALCVPVNFLLVRFFLKQDGMRIFSVFKVRREERWISLLMLALLLTLNIVLICAYYHAFTPLSKNYWTLFINTFQVSGFDPISYHVVSQWGADYNVYRHPLLAFYMYVPYLVNQALIWLTGINCAIFVVAFIVIFCAFYSFLFLYRILRELVGTTHTDASLLAFFLFSFAYVMLSAMVPDHFIISLFFILLTLYVAGKRIKEGKPLSIPHTVLLFLLAAGTSLNNGLKVFMAALFANGRGFFRLRYLLLAVLLPSLLLWLFSRFEYKQLVWEKEMARHEAKLKKKAESRKKEAEEEKKTSKALLTATNATDKTASQDAAKPRKQQQKKPRASKFGKPIGKGEFMRWTDISTSRWQSVKENLFGESIQLHQEHLLGDVFRKRPVIVRYSWTLNYVVESLIILLFALGVWAGRKSRLLWMWLSCAMLDMLLHIGLGFGINEVYIMTAHWIYVIPLSIGCLMPRIGGWRLAAVRAILILLTFYLWCYNGLLIVKYLVL